MNSENVYEKVQTIFDQVFLEKVEVTPTLSAKDVEEWDSLLQITLVVSIKKEFGIKFRTGEVERLTCMGDFVLLIQSHLTI